MGRYDDTDAVRVTNCLHCGKALRPYGNKYCSRSCALHRPHPPVVERVPDPTPLEIAIRSAQVRRTWSEDTRRERAGALYQTPCLVQAVHSNPRGEYYHDHAESVTGETIVEPSDAGPGDIEIYEMPDL